MPASGGPQYQSFTEEEPEYPIVKGPAYADGGQDTFLTVATPVRRFTIIYAGLLTSEATTLDNHAASTFGGHLSFNLTTPTGETIAGVKYDTRKRSHVSTWLQGREVHLIVRP